MTRKEIVNAEKFYNIKFPPTLKMILYKFIPASEGFYNWNDYSEKQMFQLLTLCWNDHLKE